MDNASLILKIRPAIRHCFATALKEEYVQNNGPAAGIFFDSVYIESDSEMDILMTIEDQVRNYDDKSRREQLIQAIASNSFYIDTSTVDFSDIAKLVSVELDDATKIEDYFSKHFAENTNIGGFFIAHAGKGYGYDKLVYCATLERFHMMMLPDGKVVHRIGLKQLLSSLARNFVFCIGPSRFLQRHERTIQRNFGRYVMTMKTDLWPFNPYWDGHFEWEDNSDGINSSLWRPSNMCAVWEETFHTFTEAWNRLREVEPSLYGDWNFTRQSRFGRLMARDIQEGTHETKTQNKEERGKYDFETAVNEWIHQIWLCWIAGHINRLSKPQHEALQIIKETPCVPHP